MNPSKRDAWPQPRSFRHVWVRLNRRAATPAPMPGLVLEWERDRRGRWRAFVVWIDSTLLEPRTRMEWLPVDVLRPAKSDPNVWNDGPWR
jgi:hypothetical protein